MKAGNHKIAAAFGRALVDAKLSSQNIREAAETIRREMAAIHGGEWMINVNHDSCMVNICRDWRTE